MMETQARSTTQVLVKMSLRRTHHVTAWDGRAGWVLSGPGISDESAWMIMAEFADGAKRNIVHENYKDARVAAGYVLEMHGISFGFPKAVDEWTYDTRSGKLSLSELEAA